MWIIPSMAMLYHDPSITRKLCIILTINTNKFLSALASAQKSINKMALDCCAVSKKYISNVDELDAQSIRDLDELSKSTPMSFRSCKSMYASIKAELSRKRIVVKEDHGTIMSILKARIQWMASNGTY